MKKCIFLLIITLGFLVSGKRAIAQNAGFFQNPVLGGDYPDPSVLRVGKDYYMTHSSFEYYPGLLVWHSTDLINWERIGFALDRKSVV